MNTKQQQQPSVTTTCHDQSHFNNNDNTNKVPSPKLNVFSKIIISNEPPIDIEKTPLSPDGSNSNNNNNNNNKINIFIEYSDHFFRTKNFRILFVTLTIFLCSLWVLANFDASTIHFHRKLRHYKNSRVAIVAASVMGDSGEEGIHGLEIEIHDRLSYSRSFYIVNEE